MIDSIQIKNFRSINFLRIDALKNLNIFIGKNGAGKSNILTALHNALSLVRADFIDPWTQIGITPLDFHKKSETAPIEVEVTAKQSKFAVRFENVTVKIPKLITQETVSLPLFTNQRRAIGYIHQLIVSDREIFRIDSDEAANYANLRIAQVWRQDIENLKRHMESQYTKLSSVILNPDIGDELWRRLCADAGLHIKNADLKNELFEKIRPCGLSGSGKLMDSLQRSINPVAADLASAPQKFRALLGLDGSVQADEALLEQLGEAKRGLVEGNLIFEQETREKISSEHAKSFVYHKNTREFKPRMESLRLFIHKITGYEVDAFQNDDGNCEIDIGSYNASAAGSGVNACVKFLWDFVGQKSGSIIIVEEPENHFHPLLLKQLMNYVKDQADNQFFIATHSPQLIETGPAQLFRVDLNGAAETEVTPAMTDLHRLDICDELGFRASDLLQSNCIVWVEGPSDRLYLRFWLRKKASDLIEGVHFSVLFYGGSLRSHLSAKSDQSDLSLEDFIQLLRINRNCIMLMDSDKDSEHCELKTNVIRLKTEIENNRGIAWITDGRTIENYFAPVIMKDCISEVHCRSDVPEVPENKYAKAFMRTLVEAADKVKVAQYVIGNYQCDFARLDLDERLNEIVAFIRTANG